MTAIMFGIRALIVTAGLLVVSGAAAAPKTCPHRNRPVCALTKDAKRSTFANACTAENAAARILHDGECEGGDVCSMLYAPVCAIDPAAGGEKTYSSLCVAEHGNAKIVHDGACKEQ
jgi:hypothetical protein